MKTLEETRPEGLKPASRMTCMAGQVICQQGSPSHQAFYIEEGLVEVVIEDEDVNLKLADIGPGEVFGEMGIIEEELRMATVRAVEKSRVTVMSNEEIKLRLDQVQDPVVHALIKGLSKRLRASSSEQIKNHKSQSGVQSRIANIVKKTATGINPEKRQEFAAEIEPLLNQVESVLEKYK